MYPVRRESRVPGPPHGPTAPQEDGRAGLWVAGSVEPGGSCSAAPPRLGRPTQGTREATLAYYADFYENVSEPERGQDRVFRDCKRLPRHGTP
jgi:hypothetical protein